MRTVDKLLSEYGESHQNKTNKSIHWICVPLIFFSIMGLIASIPAEILRPLFGNESPFSNWATLVLIAVMLYYLSLSVSLTVGMVLFGTVCLLAIYGITKFHIIPLWLISIIIFALAWVGQFYGHKVEGKKPSFLKDLQFLLIGPAWLMHFIYNKLRIPY